MSRTDVNIVNMALSRLGVTAQITALSETTSEAAIQANLIYEQVRDTLLADFPWKFAVKHVPLVQAIDPDQVEYSFVYEYPDDCLRILRLHTEGSGFPALQDEYEVYVMDTGDGTTHEKVVACDVEDAYVTYISSVTDPDEFSNHFTDCLAWRLAAELSVPLARDFSRRDALYKMYVNAVDSARAVDMQELYRRKNKRNKYVEAR